MGTKNNPGEFDAYSKALPDEPMFILLARYSNATKLIIDWIEDRRRRIEGNHLHATKELVAQMLEAAECAAAMILWREKNYGSWWGPDKAYIPTTPPTQQENSSTQVVPRDGVIYSNVSAGRPAFAGRLPTSVEYGIPIPVPDTLYGMPTEMFESPKKES